MSTPGQRRRLSFLCSLGSILTILRGSDAFTSQQTALKLHIAERRYRRHSIPISAPLKASSSSFDVSKPQFDFLTLRNIRGDALLRYNTLNQSEPLRINLFALLALTFFAASPVSEAVSGDQMGGLQTVASILAGIGSLGLFVRECGRRSQQLTRIEKELNGQSLLALRLPANALADRPYERDPKSFGDLLKTKIPPPRLVSLYGTHEELQKQLSYLQVFGRRLKQSETYVVPIVATGSASDEDSFQWPSREAWLAQAHDVPVWRAYFDDLISNEQSTLNSFAWFGFNCNGRSFGSGQDTTPEWLQLLGSFLRPMEILDLDSDDRARTNTSDDVEEVLDRQRHFYNCLTLGKLEEMKTDVFESGEAAPEVTEVVEQGGRIDEWSSCLADGARPQDMVISDVDSIQLSDTVAYSTCIEFPSVDNVVGGATLLAVQQWTRRSSEENWKLVLHQTIPWSVENKAQGTLRCDCRGCVALTRGNDRRTFGGLIG